MSLLSLIGRGVSVASSLLGKTANPLKGFGKSVGIPGLGKQIATGAVSAAALPAILKGAPAAMPGGAGIGGALRGLAGSLAGGAAVGGALSLLNSDGTRKKRRRINPCNDKALRRALRRIEAYDRTRKRVDKSLRKACPTPTRRAPRKC